MVKKMNNMNLNERKWKIFKVEELFEIKGSKTTKVKDLIASKSEDSVYPYVTTKGTNNGVDGFYYHKTEKGNVITFDSATKGYISYQPSDFSASDHVEIMEPIDFTLNKYTASFLITALRKSVGSKFSYGLKLSQKRMRRQSIVLPITIDNTPDWVFIERYIKEIIDNKDNKYEKYYTSLVENMKHTDIPLINDIQFKEFALIDIFTKIQRGKRLIKTNQIKGNIPYVSSTAFNNGIDNYISNENNVRRFSNCLTIANSGSVGSTFYHPYEFIASDHVTALINDDFNKYTYLFIATMINRLAEKYNFNREISDKRIEREKVMLPIDENGNLNHEYMEKFTINMIINKTELIHEEKK